VDDVRAENLREPPLEQFIDGFYCDRCKKGFVSEEGLKANRMRNHGKREDVALHFGHSVQVADDFYDKGRIDETRKAAQGYFADLSVALAKAKASSRGRRGQAHQK
jgi:hypothetical protein